MLLPLSQLSPPRCCCSHLTLCVRARRYSVISGGIKLGPQVGQGTVRFANAEESRRALLSLNHSYMGNRYIELFYAS